MPDKDAAKSHSGARYSITNEWVYFEKRFGLQVVDFMEPKPGIPPSPSQLVKVIKEVQSNNIKSSSHHRILHFLIGCVAKQTGVKD